MATSTSDPRPITTPRAFVRRIAFRLIALALALVPFALLEGSLRALGLGRAAELDDPFVGFSAVHPLFERDGPGERFAIARSRLAFFRADSFPARKPPGTRRAFVVGGSTVQGRPYGPETAFSTWLELRLNAANPGASWDMINCGGVSYASYRLVPIIQEALHHKPDLIIFYEGNNEFLEDRTYGALRCAPSWLRRAREEATRFRTFNLALAAWRRLPPGAPRHPADRAVLGPEVDARLDYRGGLDAYERDDRWHADVLAHFEANLRRMVALCRAAGVPLVLVVPVSNLDYPPLKAQHTDDLTAERIGEVAALRGAARDLYATDMPQAVALLEKAAAIDPRHAGLLYNLGQCQKALGRWTEARVSLTQAKDQDVCPLRALSSINQAIRAIARETGTPLVDAEALFAEHSPGGITGDKWLVDHVHPTIEGHRLLADALAREVQRLGLVGAELPSPEVVSRIDQAHLDQLGPEYYWKASARLANEQGWARGQSRRERPERQTTTTAGP